MHEMAAPFVAVLVAEKSDELCPNYVSEMADSQTDLDVPATMSNIKDLYIITTARNETLQPWEEELSCFVYR